MTSALLTPFTMICTLADLHFTNTCTSSLAHWSLETPFLVTFLVPALSTRIRLSEAAFHLPPRSSLPSHSRHLPLQTTHRSLSRHVASAATRYKSSCTLASVVGVGLVASSPCLAPATARFRILKCNFASFYLIEHFLSRRESSVRISAPIDFASVAS